jgi:hypothetical protein
MTTVSPPLALRSWQGQRILALLPSPPLPRSSH